MIYDILLFDLDDTLFDFAAAERQAFQAACAQLDIPANDADCRLYSEINAALWKAFERGETTQAELRRTRFARFFAMRGYAADPERMCQRYGQALGEAAILMPGALDLCRALAPDAPLHIVTNGIAETQHSRLAHSPLAPYISGLFISEELGAQKPRPAFFDAVFTSLGNPDRSRAILLGDSLTSDMAGARAAGIACCLYDPTDRAPDPSLYDFRITSLADFPPLVRG